MSSMLSRGGQGERDLLTYLNWLRDFPEKTRDEKLLHQIAFLLPVIGLIAGFFFSSTQWVLVGICGHLVAKVMYLEARMFSINYDQYSKLRTLSYTDGISLKTKDIDKLVTESDPDETEEYIS